LKENLDLKTQEKNIIYMNLEATKKVIDRAKNLIGNLSEEKERWDLQGKEFKNIIEELPIKNVLSSAFISLLGKENESERTLLLNKWCSLLKLESFEIQKLLTNESEILIYKNEGISNDNLSIENILILKNSVQLPLLIDPN